MDADTQQLATFRSALDVLDEQIVQLLGRRYAICRDVAHYKKQHRIPMMQTGRVAAVKDRCARLASAHNVDPVFLRGLYDLIIAESCRLEDEIIGSAPA
jgi:chorismate mutase